MSDNKAIDKRDLLPGDLPSAPFLPYDPPPSYEESLNHPVVSANCPQAAVFNFQNSATAQFYQNANAANTGSDQTKTSLQSKHITKQLPSAYPQQPAQYYHPPSYQSSQAIYPGQQVIVPNPFDEGARFSAISPPSIPPPPPGVAPNVAQLAARQGAVVVTSKKESSFLSGGDGAGFTFW